MLLECLVPMLVDYRHLYVIIAHIFLVLKMVAGEYVK